MEFEYSYLLKKRSDDVQQTLKNRASQRDYRRPVSWRSRSLIKQIYPHTKWNHSHPDNRIWPIPQISTKIHLQVGIRAGLSDGQLEIALRSLPSFHQ